MTLEENKMTAYLREIKRRTRNSYYIVLPKARVETLSWVLKNETTCAHLRNPRPSSQRK